MSSLSKDKSTVMSVRVPNDLRDEFIALARATGTQTSRKLREVFDMALENMRHEVNEKRSVPGPRRRAAKRSSSAT